MLAMITQITAGDLPTGRQVTPIKIRAIIKSVKILTGALNLNCSSSSYQHNHRNKFL